QAERLADYGRLLGGSQPALDGRQKDLDRIQDLFPHDFLSLHSTEPNLTCHMKPKSFRKKSFGDLQSTENLMMPSPCNRVFLVEAPCAMSPPQLPMAAKPRHLFLFSDLLLVAKPRNGGTFKLKERVRVSELWLAPYADSETGFLLGWPAPARTLLVTFCTQAARDSWWRELQQALAAQLRLEPPTTNIKVVYRDPLSGTECSKTLGVGPEINSCDIARHLKFLGAAVYDELSNTPALLLAALLKDFLRSLPEPLLVGNAQEWLNVASSGRLEHLRRLLNILPRENHVLLAHVICLLYHIAKKARYNLMSATNLGVCVGPSLLWEPTQNAPMRTLPSLMEILINQCQTLFGPQVTSLLGEVANDSGAEESDSLHSLGLSLDSTELSKDQKSLSRDSGLTLSEDDRDSPGLNYNHATFHRSDWARQAARIRSMDNTWIEEDEAFCASNESLCGPPIPPRRPPPLRHLPPVHLPPIYRPPPPPPPTYATARLLLVTDAESESYV
ncbi:hypothetical protein AMK59_2800, partial [Oryctes borbonicus]